MPDDLVVEKRRCAHDGCKAPPQSNSQWCYFHDPALIEQRHAHSVEAGRRGWTHWRLRRQAARQAREERQRQAMHERHLAELSRGAEALDKQRAERPLKQHPAHCDCPACVPLKSPSPKPQPTADEIAAAKEAQRQRERALMQQLQAEANRAELVARIFREPPKPPSPTPTVTIAGIEV